MNLDNFTVVFLIYIFILYNDLYYLTYLLLWLQLSFKKGDFLTVLKEIEGGWWEGILNGIVGWFPSNYVKDAQHLGNLIRYIFYLMSIKGEDTDTKITNNELGSHLLNFQFEVCLFI